VKELTRFIRQSRRECKDVEDELSGICVLHSQKEKKRKEKETVKDTGRLVAIKHKSLKWL